MKHFQLKSWPNLAVVPWLVLSEKQRPLPFYFVSLSLADWRQRWTNTVSFSFKLLFSWDWRVKKEVHHLAQQNLRQSTLIVHWLQKAVTGGHLHSYDFKPDQTPPPNLHYTLKNTVLSGLLWCRAVGGVCSYDGKLWTPDLSRSTQWWRMWTHCLRCLSVDNETLAGITCGTTPWKRRFTLSISISTL